MSLKKYAQSNAVRAAVAFYFAAAPLSAQPSLRLNLTATSPKMVAVPVGTVTSIPVLVDTTAAGGDLLDVALGPSSVPVTMVRPDSTIITASNATSFGFTFETIADGNSFSAPLGSFSAAGSHVRIKFGGGQSSGTYTVRVDGTALALEGAVMISYYSSSSVKAGAATAKRTYKLGDTVGLSAIVFEGSTPFVGATANAKVAAPLPLPQFSVGSFVLVAQTSPDPNTTEYEYRMTLTNNGSAAQRVIGTASSTDGNIQIVKDSVFFGDVGAGAAVVSTDTITVATPVGFTFNPASLQWSATAPSTPITVPLTDSGPADFAPSDGVYSGSFAPAAAGEYTAVVTVTGTASTGVPFNRTTTTTFSVSAPTAQILSIAEAAIDDNANGLTDRIILTANVNVQQAGSYFLSARLVAGTQSIGKSVTVTLAQGSGQIQLPFDARSIIQFLGVGGPWQRKEVVLVYTPTNTLADSNPDAGPSAAYSLNTLDRGTLALSGTNSAVGILGTGSTFDLLRVTVGLVNATTRTCSWNGTLSDLSSNRIDFVWKSGSVSAGTASVSMDFDGRKIARSGSGPYLVRDFSIQCPDGNGVEQASAAILFQTPAFNASQFTSATPDFAISLDSAVPPATPQTVFHIPLSVASQGAFESVVSLTSTGHPFGSTRSFSSDQMFGFGETMLNVATTPLTPPGVYALTVTGASSTLSHTLPVSMTVTVPASLALSGLSANSETLAYEALTSISAAPNVLVSGSATVSLKAGHSINLLPGFRASAGTATTTFRAFLAP